MTFENLSNAEQDILEALSKFGEHSEIEANEIIGYIETIKQNAINEYKQIVKDAILKYFNTTLLKLASSERLAEQRDLLLKELEMYKTQM